MAWTSAESVAHERVPVFARGVRIPASVQHPRTKPEHDMVKVGLYVRLEAKPGKEGAVLEFLKSGLGIVNEEPATVAWFALRMGPSTFGIFDAFANEKGRQA